MGDYKKLTASKWGEVITIKRNLRRESDCFIVTQPKSSRPPPQAINCNWSLGISSSLRLHQLHHLWLHKILKKSIGNMIIPTPFLCSIENWTASSFSLFEGSRGFCNSGTGAVWFFSKPRKKITDNRVHTLVSVLLQTSVLPPLPPPSFISLIEGIRKKAVATANLFITFYTPTTAESVQNNNKCPPRLNALLPISDSPLSQNSISAPDRLFKEIWY